MPSHPISFRHSLLAVRSDFLCLQRLLPLSLTLCLLLLVAAPHPWASCGQLETIHLDTTPTHQPLKLLHFQIVYLDADLLITRNIDELFTVDLSEDPSFPFAVSALAFFYVHLPRSTPGPSPLCRLTKISIPWSPFSNIWSPRSNSWISLVTNPQSSIPNLQSPISKPSTLCPTP